MLFLSDWNKESLKLNYLFEKFWFLKESKQQKEEMKEFLHKVKKIPLSKKYY